MSDTPIYDQLMRETNLQRFTKQVNFTNRTFIKYQQSMIAFRDSILFIKE